MAAQSWFTCMWHYKVKILISNVQIKDIKVPHRSLGVHQNKDGMKNDLWPSDQGSISQRVRTSPTRYLKRMASPKLG